MICPIMGIAMQMHRSAKKATSSSLTVQCCVRCAPRQRQRRSHFNAAVCQTHSQAARLKRLFAQLTMLSSSCVQYYVVVVQQLWVHPTCLHQQQYFQLAMDWKIRFLHAAYQNHCVCLMKISVKIVPFSVDHAPVQVP